VSSVRAIFQGGPLDGKENLLLPREEGRAPDLVDVLESDATHVYQLIADVGPVARYDYVGKGC
jgi:hypothetical protein